MSEQKILKFIDLTKKSVPNAEKVFKSNCTSFALMLKIAFPGGKVLHNLRQAVYQYEGGCYSISGKVEKPRGAMPIEDYGIKRMAELMQNKHSK